MPTLLQRQDAAALHFWFANFDGLRAELAIRLNRAYDDFCAGDSGQALRQALQEGATHWQSVCQQVLALHRAHGAAAQPHIRTLLEASASKLA